MIDPHAIADRVVEMIGDRAEAEVVVGAGVSALTRFADSFIHQNVGNAYQDVSLRVAVDGRVASGAVDRSDDEGLMNLVDNTLEVAGLMPVDDQWPGLASPAPVAEVEHWDDATASASSEERAAVVKAFVDAGQGYEAAGYCETAAGATAFANTLGQRLSGRSTRATVDGIHRTATSAGSAHQTGPGLAALDGAAAGKLAADRARRGMDAYDIKPGEYEVVLGPEAVATMAIFLAFYGFNAKQVLEGQSFVDLGAQQFDEALSIWDDPLAEGGLGIPFDTEGTPRVPLDLIRDGVTMGITHDRRTAARLGGESTGHAFPGSALYGPIAASLVIDAGDDPVEHLLADVDRGIYVATFNYCRVLDPKSQVVTGLTRNGTFMIENGRMTGAVTNMRFTQSFVEAFGPGRVLGVADDLRFADCEFGAGMVQAPTMRLAGFNFTGGADG